MPHSRFEALVARLNARIDWEKLDRSKGWRVDLAPIRDLLERLDRPDRGPRLVHVAGSKGKGSTAALIAAGLRRSGAEVGVFGSPHVETIRERISIDGGPLDEERFADALGVVLDTVESVPATADAADATWFDLMAATAFVAFRDAGVDAAVLEVGLGGRLDSTNVIDVPDVAVITMIALEHTAVLGDTRAKIAREKGGIIKPGGRVVTGCAPNGEAGEVLAAIVRDHGATLTFADVPRPATFEQHNLAVARAALGALGLDGTALLDGATVRAARLPGRMEERAAGGVPVLLDGAHVAESVAELVEEGRARLGAPFVALVAVHREKDAEALLAPLLEGCAHVVATTIPESRVHVAADELGAVAAAVGLDATVEPDPVQALARATEEARRRGAWVLATGSLYLVGAVRPATEAAPAAAENPSD